MQQLTTTGVGGPEVHECAETKKMVEPHVWEARGGSRMRSTQRTQGEERWPCSDDSCEERGG